MAISFKTYAQEPLFRFLVLGMFLFLLVSYIQKHKDKQAREITVDEERVGLMILKYQSQTGKPPDQAQLDAMIDDYIKEEMLYRKAKKLGLDVDDEIIRRRLAQKLEFMQSDLRDIPTPTTSDLQTFYKQNTDLFRQDATVSFSHIYFSTDHRSDTMARQQAVAVLEQLQKENVLRAPQLGDRFPLQYDYTDQSMIDIQQNFGSKPIVDSLFVCPVHTWTGPVQSGYGWHLIFVTERDTASLLPFASIENEVRSKYLTAEKTKQNQKAFDDLSKEYIINRAYLDSNE